MHIEVLLYNALNCVISGRPVLSIFTNSGQDTNSMNMMTLFYCGVIIIVMWEL